MTAHPIAILPNRVLARVEDRRVREYLLNLGHPTGGPKARFFMGAGFTSGGWAALRAALVLHGQTNVVTKTVSTEWGDRYTVECHCPTPDGRNPCIRTVWQMEDGAPRLITAIPPR